jgi:hypothetical protein
MKKTRQDEDETRRDETTPRYAMQAGRYGVLYHIVRILIS